MSLLPMSKPSTGPRIFTKNIQAKYTGRLCFFTLSSINGSPSENGTVLPTPNSSRPPNIIKKGPELDVFFLHSSASC
ncbi:unnamed protein product [Haemonchus placei]|uniref:Uncharacterized protein n=1 Tax=Haemonchus placei TaxID=6290 RepID=A0A3P7YCF7_HAEPC|nr:unnamed protein product [Haemonchus placei]